MDRARIEVADHDIRSSCPLRRSVASFELVAQRVASKHHGAQLLLEEADGGDDVCRTFTAREVKRIENWEDEGGPAYENNV